MKGLDSYKAFEELYAGLAISGSREARNVSGQCNISQFN